MTDDIFGKYEPTKQILPNGGKTLFRLLLLLISLSFLVVVTFLENRSSTADVAKCHIVFKNSKTLNENFAKHFCGPKYHTLSLNKGFYTFYLCLRNLSFH